MFAMTDELHRKFEEKMRQKVTEAPRRFYHDWEHHVSVTQYAMLMAQYKMKALSKMEYDVLRTAGLAHDVIIERGAKDNEERSADFAVAVLKELGVSDAVFLQQVHNAIVRGTKHFSDDPKHLPKTRVERLLRDADLATLGVNDFEQFLAIDQLVHREEGPKVGPAKWKKRTTWLLKKVGRKFYTPYGREVLGPQVKANLKSYYQVTLEKLKLPKDAI